MDFAVRKAQAEDGGVDDDLVTFLAIVDLSTGCMRAISPETKGATDYLASSVAAFVKNLFVERFRLRCANGTSIMAVAEEVIAKVSERVVENTTIQFGEQRPRRTSNPDNRRTAENSSIQRAESLQDANHTGVKSLAMNGQACWILCYEIRAWSGWHHTVQGSV